MIEKEKDAKKRWTVRTLNGKKDVEFFPVFDIKIPDGASSFGVATATDKDVECTRVEIKPKGAKESLIFNFLDLYMFIYFCANEELRQQLMLRYERQVSMIPYDVSFSLSPEECKAGKANRRIELPVDELTMALARDEARKIALKGRILTTMKK